MKISFLRLTEKRNN